MSVNKPAKDHLKQKFHKWFAEKVTEQIDAGKSPDEVIVDMKLTVMKEVGAKWLVSMHDYFQGHPEICKNGFVKAGITEALSNPENISTAPPTYTDDVRSRPFFRFRLRIELSTWYMYTSTRSYPTIHVYHFS